MQFVIFKSQTYHSRFPWRRTSPKPRKGFSSHRAWKIVPDFPVNWCLHSLFTGLSLGLELRDLAKFRTWQSFRHPTSHCPRKTRRLKISTYQRFSGIAYGLLPLLLRKPRLLSVPPFVTEGHAPFLPPTPPKASVPDSPSGIPRPFCHITFKFINPSLAMD